MSDGYRQRFARVVAAPESELDLSEGALLLTALVGRPPDLVGGRLLLDALAAEALDDVAACAPGLEQVQALARHLFEEHRFSGDEEDYYSPANSILDDVLERRRGIPISLSVLFMEVGRRLGLALHGVGFPAHFLVDTGCGVYLDAFHGGRLLDEAALRQLLFDVTQGSVPFDPGLLAHVDKRAILTRMLRNLKGAFLKQGDVERARGAIDWLLTIHPADLDETRDRGLLHLAGKRYDRAAADLGAYLEARPDAEDEARVREQFERARRGLWSMN